MDNDHDLASLLAEQSRITGIIYSLTTACASGFYDEADAILADVVEAGEGEVKGVIYALVGSFAGMLTLNALMSNVPEDKLLMDLAIGNERMGGVAARMMGNDQG